MMSMERPDMLIGIGAAIGTILFLLGLWTNLIHPKEDSDYSA
jgi:hypothetical protein